MPTTLSNLIDLYRFVPLDSRVIVLKIIFACRSKALILRMYAMRPCLGSLIECKRSCKQKTSFLAGAVSKREMVFYFDIFFLLCLYLARTLAIIDRILDDGN